MADCKDDDDYDDDEMLFFDIKFFNKSCQTQLSRRKENSKLTKFMVCAKERGKGNSYKNFECHQISCV